MANEREVVDRMARLHFERDFEIPWEGLDEEEREAQRQEFRVSIQGLRPGDSLGNGLVAVREEAADEIERLRQEIARLNQLVGDQQRAAFEGAFAGFGEPVKTSETREAIERAILEEREACAQAATAAISARSAEER